MTVGDLVLSVFPGIDLLGCAFVEEGYCIVRGPDVVWGGDIRTFHPPSGVFQGVIGGPPCQEFSPLNAINRALGRKPRHGNLIPEFGRVVQEAKPAWFLMENVLTAPIPIVDGYMVHSFRFNNRWIGEEQRRVRRISFGTPNGLKLYPDVAALECFAWAPTVLASGGSNVGPGGTYIRGKQQLRRNGRRTRRYLDESIRLQGLPAGFLKDAPFTVEGAIHLIGNGVPLPMGLAIAGAVRRAIESAELDRYHEDSYQPKPALTRWYLNDGAEASGG